MIADIEMELNMENQSSIEKLKNCLNYLTDEELFLKLKSCESSEYEKMNITVSEYLQLHKSR